MTAHEPPPIADCAELIETDDGRLTVSLWDADGEQVGCSSVVDNVQGAHHQLRELGYTTNDLPHIDRNAIIPPSIWEEYGFEWVQASDGEDPDDGSYVARVTPIDQD